ncbi:prolyl oligopeptidase family serine peptidase [Chitinimonas taiwanensis]|uniref:prolyl oligopeptidase family serine peptidase n=1 Tax=Chitinimonas taiwanensis TaxID=240412 RepID=UPI0035B0F0F4
MPHSARQLWRHCLTLGLLGLACLSEAAPPATALRPVEEVHHGVKVSDPYRWLEDTQTSEFRSWLAAQSAHTEQSLEVIPERAALGERIAQLSQGTAQLRELAWGGAHLFYLETAPGEDSAKLMWRPKGRGPARLLLDPQSLSRDGQRMSINYFTPSPDGRYLTVGIAAGGSEKHVLHVLDVQRGRLLDERIDRVYGGYWTVSWLPDGERFFYVRGTTENRYNKTRIYLHQLGRAPEHDPAIFGWGLHGLDFAPGDYSYVRLAPGSKHLVVTTVPGVASERHFFTAPLAEVLAGRASWRRLSSPADEWFRGYAHGQQLYVLSHAAAPRNKLLRLDLERPAQAPELVLPAGNAVLQDAAVARDGLYVQGMEAGVAKLYRVPYGRGQAQPVALPFAGHIAEMTAAPDRDGVLLKLEGWTQSPRVLAVGPGGSRDLGLLAPSPFDFSQIEVRQLLVDSHDGVRVPLTVLLRKGLALDGARPTQLSGYGAYGMARVPRFDAYNLAWLERGGVLAIAHVRGGGEFGEEWHRAGQILTKSNTVLDFVACAEALIKLGYTQPAKLAGVGHSAGGITIGAAITERPDLFAAAQHGVGMADLLRYEFTGTGPANIPEFGSVTRKYQFLAMLSVSPYQRVVDGTAYPAVILTTGLNDARVPVWQPAKLAARLQAASSSGKPVLLRTDMEGGHGGDNTRRQRIQTQTDVWAFFLSAMGEPGFGLDQK